MKEQRIADMNFLLVHEGKSYNVKMVSLITGYNIGVFLQYYPPAKFLVKDGKYERQPHPSHDFVPCHYLQDGSLTKELKMFRIAENGKKWRVTTKWLDRKIKE